MVRKKMVDMARKVRNLVRAGTEEPPAWLIPMQMFPPEVLPKPVGKPKPIEYPEDSLLKAYYDRHPNHKREPVDLNSFNPPRARRFVWRQMELMQQGMSRHTAYKTVEEEFAKDPSEQEAVVAMQAKSMIATIQEEEEKVLKKALGIHRQRMAEEELL